MAMSIQITAIHLVGGTRHEHIAAAQWINVQTKEEDQSTREQIIEWLRQSGSKAYVWDGKRSVDVRIAEATPPYIRTYADGVWTDNLLALPRF